MRRAHCIEATTTQKFFFRKYMAPPESMEECVLTQGVDGAAAVASCIAAAAVVVLLSVTFSLYRYSWLHILQSNCNLAPEDSFEEMSMNEIFNGKEMHFPGLIPLIYAYLDYIKCDSETFKRVNEYLNFIQRYYFIQSRSIWSTTRRLMLLM